ncbi:hypothetical protein BT96DRAFT_960543 [Gymnopus androsaceus JB14]|uniref:Peptidase A1 domain-containing protein n=1 Tax=Gymnopus androsaceus JB14 TaxID=1447944 RepID=A0A6A4GN40_9AGAR|nr:hypothetical protein BT96DRAFT_960543 [Gymnopus androsaceus JB14]
MSYSDSTTGTSVTAFTAVNDVQDGAAGIFGLGFPSGSDIQAKLVEAQTTGGEPLSSSDAFLNDTYKYGPLLTRITMTNQLEDDLFSISLQWDEIDPGAIDNSSSTCVPVKLYTPAEGGLDPPSCWESDIDGVFLDGKLLANSTIPATGGLGTSQISALIDTACF